jgi:membrane protein
MSRSFFAVRIAALGRWIEEVRASLEARYTFIRLLSRLIEKVGQDDVPGLAAEMAYRFLFALFPFLLFLIAAMGTIGRALKIEGLPDLVVRVLERTVPPQIAELIQGYVTDLLTTQSATVLTLGALGALWGASGGVQNLIKGLNRVYGAIRARPFWMRPLVALGTTIGLPLFMVLALLVYIFGGQFGLWLAGRLGAESLFVQLWGWISGPALVFALFLLIASLYYFLPSVRQRVWNVIPGALLATGAWLLITGGFGLYIRNFANYDVTYGSIGAAIVLLLWMYFMGMSLLVGAEVNAVLGDHFGWTRRAPLEDDAHQAREAAPVRRA